ncbi:MAG: DUF1836 domain-containing protein [Clostridium sp.]
MNRNNKINSESLNSIKTKISELIEEISDKSIISYDELPQYDLFLSQVKDYLNDKFDHDHFTNNILQNYIKSEVISKPEDGKKRGYTKLHLVQLVLLGCMRPVLTTDEIKDVFRLAFNGINNRADDILSWEDTYKLFCYLQKESFNIGFLENKGQDVETLLKYFDDYDFSEQEQERIAIFLIVMSLVAQASNIKKLVSTIVKEYGDKY